MDQPPAPRVMVDDNVAKGLRRVGWPEAAIEAMQAKERAEVTAALANADFEVHEDNWESWRFFLDVDTQWRYVSIQMGWKAATRRIGMNYSGVQAGATLAGWPRKKWPALFADLKVIEEAVLKADTERQALAN